MNSKKPIFRIKEQIWFIASFIVCAYACTSSSQENENQNSDNTNITQINQSFQSTSSNEYFDYSNTHLEKEFQDSSRAHFSDTESHDVLTMFISKGRITETRVTIRVHNAKKQLIYQHVFPTYELVYGYDLDKIFTDKQMEEYIIQRAKAIAHQSFIYPNTLSDEHYLNQTPKEDFINYETLQEIKKSKCTILHYTLRTENHIYQGYSKKLEQVVQLIFCC